MTDMDAAGCQCGACGAGLWADMSDTAVTIHMEGNTFVRSGEVIHDCAAEPSR